MKNLVKKLLIKSQKITGTDNAYIIKHGSYLMIGNIISIVSSFLLSITFARLLSQEVYGQYNYILSIMAILAISSLHGINTAIIQGVSRGFDGVLKKGLEIKLKWGLLGSIGSIGVALYFWLQGNGQFTIAFLIIAIFLPLFKGGEIYQSYLDGKKLFGKRATYSTLIQVLSTVIIIFTLFLTKNLIILILVYFLSYSLLRVLFLFLIIKKTKPNSINNPEFITYGKHLSLMGIVGLVAQQIDKILLFNFIGPIQLAIYSFATLPVEHIRTPLQFIQEIALPKLSNQPNENIKKTLPKKLFIIIIVIITIIVLYYIVSPYFFQIFYPQYTESVFYSRLFSLTLLVFPVSMMTLSIQARMQTKELYKISIINPAFQIILMIVLIPSYGILGAIIAKLISQIFYFFLALHFFKRL